MATKTKSIFELMYEFNDVEIKAAKHIDSIFAFFNDANKQRAYFERKLLEKQMLFVATSQNVRQDIENLPEDGLSNDPDMKVVIDRLSTLKYVDKYSTSNIFVWLKRYHRLYKSLSNELSQKKEYSQYLLGLLKQLSIEFEPHKHTKQVQSMKGRMELLRENLLTSCNFKLEMHDCYSMLEILFVFAPVITKNELLSLITIRRDINTLKAIAALPDELTFEDVRQAIFIHGIEDDHEQYLNHFFINHFLKIREENPKLAEEIDEALGLDMVPTMEVSFDEYGQISDIKPSPPKIKLVK